MAADGTVTIQIKAEGKQAERSVQGLKGVFEGLGSHVQKTTSKVTDMVKAFGLVKLAQAGFNLLRNSMDGAIKRLDTLRTSDKVFENMGFSADETSRMMDNLNASIKGLPTPLNEAVNGVQLLASSTGDLTRSEQIYSALNNAVLGFGGSSEMANNAVLQLSQGLADGRIRGQEWNSMLNSNMGPSLRAIADMMGLTMGELKSGLSDGSIAVDDFMDTLITLNEEGGGGLASLQQIAQDATGGIQTSMANMRTAVSRGLANMIESIDNALVAANFPSIGEMISKVGETIEGALNKASEAVVPLIGWLVTLFTTVKNSTAFQSFKQVVSDAFETAREMISNFAQSEAWETIKNAIKQVADAVLSIDFGEVITQLVDFIDKWSPLIAGIMGAVGAFKIISGVIATVTAVKTALLAVTSLFGAALVAINWPLVAIAAAIGAVIAVGVLLYRNWDEIRTKAVEIWTSIVDWFSQVWETITSTASEAWEGFKTYLTTLWDSVVSSASEIWDGIKSYFSELWASIGDGLTTFWNSIKEFFTTTWESIKNIFQSAWDGIQTVILVAWEVIKNIIFVAIGIVAITIQTVWDGIMVITQTIWDVIGEYILAIWEFIKTGVQTGVEFVSNLIDTGWNFIKDLTSTVWDAISNVILTVWEVIKNYVTTATSAVSNTVSTVWNAIKNVTSTVWNAVKDVIQNVWNVIKTHVTNAINTVKNIITTVWNAVSSVTSNVWNSIRSTTSSVWNGIKSTISNILNSIKSTFSNIFNSLRSVVTGAFNNVKNAVRTGMNNAWTTVTSFFSKFRNAGKNIVQNIADGITGAIGKVTSAIGSVTQKIRDFLPFSPPKDKSSPLVDIHKNGIGEQIAKGIVKGEVEVQQAMHHLLEVPDINKYVPQFGTANAAGITNINQSQNTYDDTNVISLLQRIANKDVDLYIDDRVLVGHTKDKYNQEFGNDLELRKRGRS